ncbi:hypothetical protein ACIPVK_13775 [Paeniglutamicibacter sp. MACA_103]|uniref:hypothetical protein n=1 Tax=Paeniglutamicibacter sp. MACA_103 TaxID=3377337 RepID=UPI0038952D76
MNEVPRSLGGRRSLERLRLLTKDARMYHEQSMRQPAIASTLGMSQSRVSRSLKEAAGVAPFPASSVSPADP